jgi:hypothetical protein
MTPDAIPNSNDYKTRREDPSADHSLTLNKKPPGRQAAVGRFVVEVHASPHRVPPVESSDFDSYKILHPCQRKTARFLTIALSIKESLTILARSRGYVPGHFRGRGVLTCNIILTSPSNAPMFPECLAYNSQVILFCVKDHINGKGINMKKTVLVLGALGGLLAGCQPAIITATKWDSGISGDRKVRCERVDMRDNEEMTNVFSKYDGWKLVYLSEYTTGNKVGTDGAACFEKALK